MKSLRKLTTMGIVAVIAAGCAVPSMTFAAEEANAGGGPLVGGEVVMLADEDGEDLIGTGVYNEWESTSEAGDGYYGTDWYEYGTTYLYGGTDHCVEYGTDWYEEETTEAQGFIRIQQGDVNLDGDVNRADYILLERYLDGDTSVFLGYDNKSAADMNGDGNVDQDDLRVLGEKLGIAPVEATTVTPSCTTEYYDTENYYDYTTVIEEPYTTEASYEITTWVNDVTTVPEEIETASQPDADTTEAYMQATTEETTFIPVAFYITFTPDEADEDGTVTLTEEMFTAQFDKEAVEALAQAVGEEPVKLLFVEIPPSADLANDAQQEVLEEVFRNDGMVFDLSLMTKSGKTVAFTEDDPGFVTVTMPYKASGDKVYVFYIDENGNRTDMNAVYDAKSETVTFKTSHFSLYSVEEKLPQTGNASVKHIVMAIAALLLMAGGCAAVYCSGILRRREEQ